MDSKIHKSSFNLLNRFQNQRGPVDKLYDFVIVEGRYVVVGVMFLIILAFIYRFPLDRALNDEVNRSKTNLNQLQYYSEGEEKEFRNIIQRTNSAKNYTLLYPDDFNANGKNEGQVQFADVLKRLREITAEFNGNIILIDYTYSADPAKGITLKITGSSSTFAKAEEFRDKIRAEKQLVVDVLMQTLSSAKDTAPKFSLDLKIKSAQ